MDFLNRSAGNQPQPGRVPTTNGSAPAAPHQPQLNKSGKGPMALVQPGWLRIAFVILLFSVTGLAVALALFIHKGSAPREDGYINTAKYQAVFLTNGQVYFGKIKDITSKYVDLQDIYYLNTQQADNTQTNAQPTSFSLVKLGCELHGPNDQMVVNREQITFWENLKDDGQVADAISKWQEQNPKGQECQNNGANTTQQSSTNSSQSTQNTATQTPAKKP